MATSAFALACFLIAGFPSPTLLEFDRTGILNGEIWRLWTGHLVHYSQRQALLDCGMLVLAGSAAERALGTRVVLSALLLGIPTISLGLLLFSPDMTHYRGASGMAMLLVCMAATTYWYRLPKLRLMLSVLGLSLLAKILLDASGHASSLTNLPDGVRVAWLAHLMGAGLGWVAAYLKLRDSFQPLPQPHSDRPA